MPCCKSAWFAANQTPITFKPYPEWQDIPLAVFHQIFFVLSVVPCVVLFVVSLTPQGFNGLGQGRDRII